MTYRSDRLLRQTGFFCMCANRRYMDDQITGRFAGKQNTGNLAHSPKLQHQADNMKHSCIRVVKLCQVQEKYTYTPSRQLVGANVPPLPCMHHHVSQST